ncbi:MAG: hypothetical protein NZZ41_02740 [Candidatus Dojkabacteria bacterium]|nr:hypothetical protein [Candidatus Dojkabacteria bacterium]
MLQRIVSYDQTTEITNSIVNVELGQQNGSRSFFQKTENPVV